MTQAQLLEARGLRKVFPGVRALDGVDFNLRRGEIHTIMGENGAGKSTLIKLLTGVYGRDGGEMRLDGRAIHPRSPLQAQQLGISTVYQEVNLVAQLSVMENLFLGRQPTRWGMIDWKAIQRGAEQAMTRLDLHIDVTQTVGSYSIAIQQMVAIARALDVDSRVLILDEPTSSLDAGEVAQLFAVMRKLRQQGMGIVFISHFLDQVYTVSDRFTVLRNGQLVGEYEARSLPRLELIAKMLGREPGAVTAMPRHPEPTHDHQRQTMLHAQGIGRAGSIGPVDVTIHRGEVVALAGLLGSGRTEVARMLFGVDPAQGGAIEVDGLPQRISSPRVAMALGLGFCPEDRKTAGAMPSLSVRQNIVIALQSRRGWLNRISPAKQQELADRYIAALGIATPDADKPIAQLSGGNQQKVILARWLATSPRLLILDEPTRGIDIGAKAEIEKLMAQLCAEGMAILFISSELEEVARDSHRVVVLRDRKKVGQLSGEQISVDAIMHIIAETSRA